MFSTTKPLILASNSPRRKDLLSQLGYAFETCPIDADESFPEDIDPLSVASFICKKKAEAILGKYPNHLAITADTVVVLDDQILGKPQDIEEARSIVQKLSGRSHQVVTAFCLVENRVVTVFEDIATVWFKTLSETEIDYYLSSGSPLDKAGAYGIQEWIGLIGIEKIQGSFFTIMGLPTHLLFENLKPFTVASPLTTA